MTNPRLLFLLSADHGELFNALYFLLGTRLSAVLLMPPRLFALNRGTLPYPLHVYRSSEDVCEVLAREPADVVLLFSGYLYVVNKVLTQQGLQEVLAALKGRRVVTSDPALGIPGRLDERSVSDRHPRQAWLQGHLLEMFARLKDIPHLYLAPGLDTAVRAHSFFNPKIVLSEADLARCRRTLCQWTGLDPAARRWLYVLSAEDYSLQAAGHGQARFIDRLVRRLQDAVEAGRQPVLVAPSACVEAVRQHGGIPDLLAFAGTKYTLFMLLLHDAEYVFYWNLFSASILSRILNRQPFFFFEHGHLAEVLTPLLAVGSAHFYPGCRLRPLAPDEVLTADRLAVEARAQEAEVMAPVFAHLSASPSPERVVAELTADG